MSYDIGLYDKQFLKRALDESLGDWTCADPFPNDKLRVVRERLKAMGYRTLNGIEFEHSNATWGLQVSIFAGEISFCVPYWDDAKAAVGVARADALELAKDADLGFYDPQSGEAIT